MTPGYSYLVNLYVKKIFILEIKSATKKLFSFGVVSKTDKRTNMPVL
jgi:hypothetical protein